MNNRQENKLSMYRATAKVLAENSGEYGTVKGLTVQVGLFNDSIELIGQLVRAQTTNTTGIAGDKTILQNQMVDTTLRVAGALKAFASEENNTALRNQADINKTTFSRARDDERDDIAQAIHDLGAEHILQLGAHGVTDSTLTALQTRISAYVDTLGSPKAARAKKTTATEMLETEFTRADMILEDRIDGLMEQFKDSGTTFYSNYKNARRIDQTGSQGSEPENPTPAPAP